VIFELLVLVMVEQLVGGDGWYIVIFPGCRGYGMVDSGCQWFVMIDVGCY
jgi:hypothetical protein